MLTVPLALYSMFCISGGECAFGLQLCPPHYLQFVWSSVLKVPIGFIRFSFGLVSNLYPITSPDLQKTETFIVFAFDTRMCDYSMKFFHVIIFENFAFPPMSPAFFSLRGQSLFKFW